MSTTTYTPDEDSYVKKIEEAQATIKLHNDQLSESDRLDWDGILSEIKKLGGTTDATLDEMTWEDLEACGIPRVLARKIAKIFRTRQDKSKIPGKKTLRQLGLLELLQQYDPFADNNHTIKNELENRTAPDVRFIVFDGNTVDAELSHKLWLVYKETGLTGPITNIGGQPRKTYYIGQTPPRTLEENPLIKGRPLVDGCCDRSGIVWSAVPLEIRQFVRVIMTETGFYSKVADMLDFFENLEKMSISAGGWDKLLLRGAALAGRYPEQWLIFEELKNNNQLPQLRSSIVGNSASDKLNNPFGNHKTY